MYSASQREIGQHDNRVCLDVRAKLLSYHRESRCYLFETGIPGFYFSQRFAYEEYWSLLLVFVFFELSCCY